MDELLSEKEQIEQIRSWWAENGRFVITGLVLGVVVLAGWRYWTTFKLERAEAASVAFDQLIEAVDRRDRDAAVALADRLDADYSATPYAADGALAIARLHVELGDAEAAAGVLRDLVSRAGKSQVGHVARLRLARILLHLGKADEALPLVSGVNAGPFESRYAEVRGDIAVASGDMETAREAYRAALDAAQPGMADRNLLQMKLDQAAPAASAAVAVPAAPAAAAEPADGTPGDDS